jgi:hypothetical protein
MTQHHAHTPPAPPATFTPVAVRQRHDGWTPERQVDFIRALAECACVTEAAERVGVTTHSAYRLRARADAASFRAAWDAALDLAIDRLADAAFSRALHGVARPIFYQGEQVGERRHYDERLTMFLLRYRDPARFGAWLDGAVADRAPDGPGRALDAALADLARARIPADAPPPAPGRKRGRRAADPLVLRRRQPDQGSGWAASPDPWPTEEETNATLSKLIDRMNRRMAREAARQGDSGGDVPSPSPPFANPSSAAPPFTAHPFPGPSPAIGPSG